MASHLCKAQKFIRDRVINNFSQADDNLGKTLSERVEHYIKN